MFPGRTSLAIQKSMNATLGLSSPFGNDGTAYAQLWYSPDDVRAPLNIY